MTTGVLLQWLISSEKAFNEIVRSPSVLFCTIGCRCSNRLVTASDSLSELNLQKIGSVSQIWMINVSYFFAFRSE